jgi:hypothetical protein
MSPGSAADEIRLAVAAFLDSSHAAGLDDARRKDARAVLERFLACAYDELGKAPRLLEPEDLAEILLERLPAHFGARDRLAAEVEPVLALWHAHLGERAIVPYAYELGLALEQHAPAFRAAVAAGELAGRAPRPRAKPFVHRAQKTGRNDPCPCGSGKKFKQCCMRLGS